MTYKSDSIAEKLDKLAEATGVPAFQRKLKSRDPVRFRVLPSVLLAIAVAGMAVQIGWGGLAGFWLVWIGWIGTFMCQPFGPMGRPVGRKLDEREAAVVRTGHFTGMMWALGVAILGSLTITFGKAWAILRMGGLWAPETPMDWMTITLFLLAVETNVAVLAASAAMPEPLDDEEE
jgi:hypothetical protein